MRSQDFDASHVRKLVGLFDSPRSGEAETSVRKCCEYAASHNMRLGEALEKAFGDADLTEMRDVIETLETEKRELSEGLLAMEEKMHSMERSPMRTDGNGFRGFLDDLWGHSQTRLILVLVTVSLRMWSYAGLEIDGTWPGWYSALLNMALPLCFMVALVKWTGLQYQNSGKAVVIVKGVIVIAGSVGSVMAFCATADFHTWFAVHGSTEIRPAFGFLALGATLLFSVTNVADRIVKIFGQSEWGAFPVLRSWFM